MRSLVSVIACGSLAIVAAPAFGQADAQEAPKVKEKRICRTEPIIGSRLAKKRFCGTREEWEERRLSDRQAVEKVQMGPCVVNGTTCK